VPGLTSLLLIDANLRPVLRRVPQRPRQAA